MLNRRETLAAGAGATAALAPLRASAEPGHIWTADGTKHRVTDAWWAENVEPWPHIQGLPQGAREALRLRLLTDSNDRELTAGEAREIEALTRWKNVERAWTWLAGRHWREFGFVALDQVHGNSCRHSCGCVTQYVFDHNLRSVSGPRAHYPHYPQRVCEAHEALRSNWRAHYVVLHPVPPSVEI